MGLCENCSCLAASSGFSYKLSVVSEVGCKQMIGGVWSYVATWADIGYIVVKPGVVAGEVS